MDTLLESKEERWRCRRHTDKFVCPSRQKLGRRTDCAQCKNDNQRSSEAKKRRAKKWEKEFIACAYHPERRCNKSVYAGFDKRRCGSCSSKNRPSEGGPKKGAHVRRKTMAGYKISLKLRERGLGRLRGLALFERSTGLKLS